ncbi:hypothetical protein [Photobacterium leiognathi]|uniref:hypothetical protein n=1 Tax=Photobacterium leiognathi TaxID=553611 RepID=UPI0027352DD8|nr:hypothetical protein [Photobacterium leiognathi]
MDDNLIPYHYRCCESCNKEPDTMQFKFITTNFIIAYIIRITECGHPSHCDYIGVEASARSMLDRYFPWVSGMERLRKEKNKRNQE